MVVRDEPAIHGAGKGKRESSPERESLLGFVEL
jgi:hypothetical protein